jgi:hypothetical protein
MAMDDLALALYMVTTKAGNASTRAQIAPKEVQTAKLKVEHWKSSS